jgi:hypothetical protein
MREPLLAQNPSRQQPKQLHDHYCRHKAQNHQENRFDNEFDDAKGVTITLHNPLKPYRQSGTAAVLQLLCGRSLGTNNAD